MLAGKLQSIRAAQVPENLVDLIKRLPPPSYDTTATAEINEANGSEPKEGKTESTGV